MHQTQEQMLEWITCNIYSKMFTHDVGDRTIVLVTSGNLGTSQAVYKSIEKDLKE